MKKFIYIFFVANIVFNCFAGEAYNPEDPIEKLIAAAEGNNTKTLKKLINSGINVNTKNRYDWTAIRIAAECGHVEAFKLLLEAGSDILMTQDSEGHTLKYYYHDKPELVEIVNTFLAREAIEAELGNHNLQLRDVGGIVLAYLYIEKEIKKASN